MITLPMSENGMNTDKTWYLDNITLDLSSINPLNIILFVEIVFVIGDLTIVHFNIYLTRTIFEILHNVEILTDINDSQTYYIFINLNIYI